jgi:hypothetical protein
MTPRIPPEAAAAAARGDLIEAIKRTREVTGLGLKESKELVEAHLRGQAEGWNHGSADDGAAGGGGMAAPRQPSSAATPARRPGLAPGEEPPGRFPWGLLAVLVAGAVAVYLLVR